MYLKSVKARGFKSFGRPVEMTFETGITVVVGPNGSGKSNIADAVMWAMGEQSPSAIRGASMRDFIFSGSDKLSPAGVAEVEITLDNGNGAMPIEFSEVSISRRLYREGEGTYFINRSPCRLTDVVELLSDTGLGKNAHSIISQGKVDSILESRPRERRACIEEAAGLGKYKKRRHRAEVKLRAVKRNLERLADVEEEVRSNLRPLKRQATAAERSSKLDLKIAAARAGVARGRLEILGEKLKAAEALSQEAMARRAEMEDKLSAVSRERQATEEELSASIQGHKELAGRFYKTGSQLEGLTLRCEAVRQKQGMLKESRRRLEARTENLKGQADRVDAELMQAESQRQQDQVRLKEIEEELAARNAELEMLDGEISTRQRAGEEKARRAVELEAARERCRHQIGFLTQRQEKLNAAVSAAASELNERWRELQEVEAAVAAGEQEASMLKAESGRLQSLLKDLREVREDAESEHQAVAGEQRRTAEDLQIAKARLTFIGDSHRDRSGLPPAAKKISDEHAVKALMELIEIEPGYERAVAAVLGSRIFALAVRDFEHGRELLKAVREGELGSAEFIFPSNGCVPGGRGTFSSERMPGGNVDGGDFLLDHIEVADGGAGRVAALLDGVRVVDDIVEAPAGEAGIWVTRDGVVFDAGSSLLSFRDERPSSMVLKQRNERARLEKELQVIEDRQEELERRVAELEEELRQAAIREKKAAGEHAAADSRHREKEETLAGIQARKRVLRQEVEFKEAVLKEYRDEINAVEAELKVAGQGLSEAESALEAAGAGGSDAGMGEAELAGRRVEVAGKVTALEVAAAQVRERERLASLTATRAAGEKERIDGEARSVKVRLGAERRLEPVCEKLLALMERLKKVYGLASEELKEQMGEVEELSGRRSSALRELSRTEAELQQQLSLASDVSTEREVEVAKLRDQLGEQQARLENLKGRHPDAGLDEIEAVAAGEIEQVEEQIERFYRQRELIGPVNPLAQKEYDEMLKRKEFLAGQRADLEKSLKELTGLISELTTRIEESFDGTFDVVRKNFSEVIATLFPGGEGRLTLVEPDAAEQPPAGEMESGDSEAVEAPAGTGPDAGLESIDGETAVGDENTPVPPQECRGIEISVKPPRKAVRNLSLLSGGERSLVAIAFLFAIFLARPAPFYILDEVEAALDDINISRLLGMLRSFQDRTQIIVITHQKRTMEVADILYGVSMGPDGTSRVLSRKMPEAGGQPPEVEPAAGQDERQPAAVAG